MRLVLVLAFVTVASAHAQGLDPSPVSLCGTPRRSASALDVGADSRVLLRFAPATSSNEAHAVAARAFSTLVGERMRRALPVDVQAKGLAGGVDAASAVAEGRVLGVRFVMVGMVRIDEEERTSVSWRLVDARTGVEVAAGTVSERLTRTDDLVQSLTSRLSAAFGEATDGAVHSRGVDRVTSSSPAAVAALFEALGDFDSFDRARLAMADVALQRAIEADPRFAAAHFRLAQLRLHQLDWVEQRDIVRQRLVYEGLRAVGSALLADPHDPRALVVLGRLLIHAGTADNAWPIVRTLHGMASGREAALLLHAWLDRSNGDDRGALKRLRAAPASAARSTEALMLRADLERRVGDAVVACRFLNRALALDPVYVPAYVWRAVVRSQLGERREGWADAEVAARLGRNDWGELAGALVDLSVADTVRARERLRPFLSAPSLAEAGFIGLVLRAAVAEGVRQTDRRQLVLRQVACNEPRRKAIEREPLLRFARLPGECGGAVASAR